MLRLSLSPLDARVAKVLADRRGVTVQGLIADLLREEAAIEITNWRTMAKAGESTSLENSHNVADNQTNSA